jgi:ATP-dependent DNA helicase RecQ
MSETTTAFSAVRFPDRNNINNMAQCARGFQNLNAVLKRMGFDKLRKGQDGVITSIMCNRDTLCVLPTATGKSACFTIPTLALDWRTLIFVPLVALMRDQVQSLWRKGISEAGCLSSLQSEGENVQVARDWMSGKLRFLFVAPERLRNPWFQQAMKAVAPDLIAVDEAHCLSEHGDDFRPDYCKIGDYLRENPPKVVAAFSATVDEEAELDIRRVLCMNNAVKVTHMPRRKNLILSSSDLTHDNDVVDFLEEKIKEKESFVVYCSTVKHVEEFTIFLQANLKGEVGMYHGKLTPAQKRSMQDEFMKDRVPGVVATNAFGMGVDKPNIRAVVYRDMPGNLGELSQGQGRAGRDGNISHCHTFFDDNGLRTQNWFLMTKYPSESAVRSVFLALKKLQKPNGMVQASYDDIAKVAQGHAAQIGAALQNLKAAAVIESTRPETKNHKIKFLDEVPKAQDLRFEEYKHVINQIGVEDNNTGLLMVDADTLAERLDVGDQTIRNNLRKYQSAGFLYFEPPYNGSDIKIIGGIERMEFGRLKDKQAAAEKKLKMVLDYNHVPDDQKHSFLEKYFGITEPSE